MALFPVLTWLAVMNTSNQSDLLMALRNWSLGVLVALGPSSVLATDTSPNDESAVRIVLTGENLRVDSVELCSLSELRPILDTQPRSTPVTVEATAESRTAILFKIRETLTTLGFEQVTYEGWDGSGWDLYPPSQDTKFHGCDQSESEDSVEAE